MSKKHAKIEIKDETVNEEAAAAEIQTENPECEAAEEKEELVTLAKAELDALNTALEEARKKEQENLEGWQRERADFSNYKKRIERDQEAAKNSYKADVLKKFIPVLDDLELAYQHRPEDGEASAWADGIGLILRKFSSVLENDGLTQIAVKAGDKLDPNIHMAVSAEESDEFESEQIIEVLKNGYRMGDKIINPAIVRVAR